MIFAHRSGSISCRLYVLHMYAVQDSCGGFLRLRHERRAPLTQGISDCRTPKVFKLLPVQPGDAWRLLSSWSCSKSSWFCQHVYNSSIAYLIGQLGHQYIFKLVMILLVWYNSPITPWIGRSCPGYFKNLNAFLSTRSWFFQATGFLKPSDGFPKVPWFWKWNNLIFEHACFCKLVLGLFYNIRSWSGWSWHFHARHKFSIRLLVFCKSLFWHISFYDHSECMMVVELETMVSMALDQPGYKLIHYITICQSH